MSPLRVSILALIPFPIIKSAELFGSTLPLPLAIPFTLIVTILIFVGLARLAFGPITPNKRGQRGNADLPNDRL